MIAWRGLRRAAFLFVITIGVFRFAAIPTLAQSTDPFLSAPAPAPAPVPRPARRPLAPREAEPEPVIAAPPAAPKPAPVLTNYDGVYTGEALRRTDSNGCPGASFTKSLTIRNSLISYVFNQSFARVVTGTVGNDGTVSAASMTEGIMIKLTGSIRGGDYVGVVTDGNCRIDLRFHKQP